MAPILPSRPRSFEEFGSLVGPVLGIPPERLQASDYLGRDVAVDELSLVELVLAIQDVNPYFEVPSQLDIQDVTLGDLYHFCCVMDAGHAEQPIEEHEP